MFSLNIKKAPFGAFFCSVDSFGSGIQWENLTIPQWAVFVWSRLVVMPIMTSINIKPTRKTKFCL